LLVRDGELTTANEAEVLVRAHDSARAMFARTGISTRF
jgi:hypothetical protein